MVRTTVLLRILDGEVYWITDPYNIPLFPDNLPALKIVDKNNISPSLYNIEFDLVINLEEDPELAEMMPRLTYSKLTGVYKEQNILKYTTDSAAWYDMSLISKYARSEADDLKRINRLTYQEILFGMLGKKFLNEKYLIFESDSDPDKKQKLVGIDSSVGKTWPNKSWSGYNELGDLLDSDKYAVLHFEKKSDLRHYLGDVRRCSVVVCGDTLTMHVALACNIPVVAIFNCTSPHEIHDYGIMQKMISPYLYDHFYSRDYCDKVVSSIPVRNVYDAVCRVLAL